VKDAQNEEEEDVDEDACDRIRFLIKAIYNPRVNRNTKPSSRSESWNSLKRASKEEKTESSDFEDEKYEQYSDKDMVLHEKFGVRQQLLNLVRELWSKIPFDISWKDPRMKDPSCHHNLALIFGDKVQQLIFGNDDSVNGVSMLKNNCKNIDPLYDKLFCPHSPTQ